MFWCSESAAQNQNDAIQEFIRGTIAESAPVVPISAQLKYNVDAVCEYIVKRIPVPVRDFTSPPQMIVIRSFDVNKPGSEVEELRGGVAGGSILQVSPGHFSCGCPLVGWDPGSFRHLIVPSHLMVPFGPSGAPCLLRHRDSGACS